MLIFQGFLRPKKPLVATFSEAYAPSSKTNVAEQGTDVPNWSETLTFFGSHSTVFALVKMALKMLNFQSFYLYKKLSTLSDTRPLISSKYPAEQGMSVWNLSEIFKLLWLQTSAFAFD